MLRFEGKGERRLARLDRASGGELLLERRRPVGEARFGNRQLHVDEVHDLVATGHDVGGDVTELLLIPTDFFGQFELDVQWAVVDVRGAEVAAGIAQRGTGLFAVGGIERRVELATRLLEPIESFVEVLVDLSLLRGGQCGQLADGHRGDVGGKEGDVVHGIAPQTAARSDVESCSASRSNSMTASTG